MFYCNFFQFYSKKLANVGLDTAENELSTASLTFKLSGRRGLVSVPGSIFFQIALSI